MKVKNIMFSGFAAAVLAGVCGAAEAADYTLASQGYVTKQLEGKQNVLTAGDGIAIEGDTISAVSGLQDESGNPVSVETALSEVVTSVATVENKLGELPEGQTVAEALSEKQATLENAAVLETITSDDVASIGTTAAAVETLSQKAITTDNMTEQLAGYATDGELTAVTDIATAAGTAAGAAQADVDALELVVTDETTGLGSKVSQATYDAHLESQKAIDDQQTADIASNKRAIDGLSGVDGEGFATLVGDVDALKSAVNNENGAVATKIAAAIETETERANAAYAPASLTGTVEGLATTVEGKADASALQNYVETATFTEYQGTVTTALSGKQDTITDLDTIKSGAAAGATAVQPEALTETLAGYQEAGNYLTDTMTAKGTYLVKRAEDGTVSYVSVDVIGENGSPVEF